MLKEMMNVSLLRETPFFLTCIGYSLSMLGYFVPIVYILDEAIQHVSLVIASATALANQALVSIVCRRNVSIQLPMNIRRSTLSRGVSTMTNNFSGLLNDV